MRLIYSKGPRRGAEVKLGDQVLLTINEPRAGRLCSIVGIEEPRHAASTGRVYLEEVSRDGVPRGMESYFPSIIGAEWDKRTDREPIRTPTPLSDA